MMKFWTLANFFLFCWERGGGGGLDNAPLLAMGIDVVYGGGGLEIWKFAHFTRITCKNLWAVSVCNSACALKDSAFYVDS